jgi:hypothetical protein
MITSIYTYFCFVKSSVKNCPINRVTAKSSADPYWIVLPPFEVGAYILYTYYPLDL